MKGNIHAFTVQFAHTLNYNLYCLIYKTNKKHQQNGHCILHYTVRLENFVDLSQKIE